MSESQNEQRKKIQLQLFISQLRSVPVEKPLLDYIKFAQLSVLCSFWMYLQHSVAWYIFLFIHIPNLSSFLYQGLQHSDIKKKNYRTTCLQIVLDFVFVCVKKEKSKGQVYHYWCSNISNGFRLSWYSSKTILAKILEQIQPSC